MVFHHCAFQPANSSSDLVRPRNRTYRCRKQAVHILAGVCQVLANMLFSAWCGPLAFGASGKTYGPTTLIYQTLQNWIFRLSAVHPPGRGWQCWWTFILMAQLASAVYEQRTVRAGSLFIGRGMGGLPNLPLFSRSKDGACRVSDRAGPLRQAK